MKTITFSSNPGEIIKSLGPRGVELSELLYSKIQSQDVLSMAFDWCDPFLPFARELRELEASGVLNSRAMVDKTNEFKEGFRLDPIFVAYLGQRYADPREMRKLTNAIENADEQLNGLKLRTWIDVPVVVIHSFFKLYEAKGQGIVSETVGESIYIPYSE